MTIIDVGDLIHISSSLGSIDGHFYISRVKITIAPGEIYTVECLVEKKLSIMSGSLTNIGVEFRGEDSKDAINFGHLPFLADLPARTMSAWVWVASGGASAVLDYVMGFFADASAHQIVISNNSDPAVLGFYQKYAPNGQQYWFANNTSALTRNQWHHIVVYKDRLSNNPPKFYIDGVQQTANLLSSAVVGLTAYTDTGVPFILGNIKTATIDYAWGFSGRIQDARVFNKELIIDEIVKLYNNGVPDPSVFTDSSMIFQAIAVRTANLSSYIDQPLAGKNVFDNVFRAVGTVNDSPIGRTAV
jgi:hypothetical protein